MKLSDVIIVLFLVLALAIFGVGAYVICTSDLPTWAKLWFILRG